MTDMPVWAAKLTRRQRQICRLIVMGWNAENIGHSLGISPRTVEDHRVNIYRKSNCHSLIDLVRLVYDLDEPPSFLERAGVAKSPQPEF
jgi:DNA-binding NarL/FixJ family response regulator